MVYFEIFINQYNIPRPLPYTAKSIVNQLTQLFSHMFIHAFTNWHWLLECKASGHLGHLSLIHRNFNRMDSFQYWYTALVLILAFNWETSTVHSYGLITVLGYCFGPNPVKPQPSICFTYWDSIWYSSTELALIICCTFKRTLFCCTLLI